MCENKEKRDIWSIINTVRFSMVLGEGAGRADKMFYQHLYEGLEENNLDKIYEFILALERGRGLSWDKKLNDVIQEAYEKDSEQLGRAIVNRGNLLDYWVLLSAYCSTEMLTRFVYLKAEYTIFYYECARLLLQRSYFEKGCEEAIIWAVIQLANKDLGLWKRWIIKNEHNKIWQGLYGKVLGRVNEDALKTYANTIDFHILENMEIITKSFDMIDDVQREYILDTISDIIFKRWIDYLEDKKIKKTYENKIIISAYANIIIVSMASSMKLSEWEHYFIKSVDILEHDLFEWYKSITQMKSYFFINMTQIYYLLHSRMRQLSDIRNSEVSESMEKLTYIIKQYEYMWDKANDYNIKEELMQILKLPLQEENLV